MSDISPTIKNACKYCPPLGACLAFKGIAQTISLIHGSQGCATYIRRYFISHFREPFDIASSSFQEHSAIFGGQNDFNEALDNIIQGYRPKMIGISTTCLSETMGENIPLWIYEYEKNQISDTRTTLVHVSTPGYRNTHYEGYHDAVRAIIQKFARVGQRRQLSSTVNIFPGILSPSDLRLIKEITKEFGLYPLMVPDYSDSLDGGRWEAYKRIPEGGTPLDRIRKIDSALASIELGACLKNNQTAAGFLKDNFQTPRFSLGIPVGITETDRFFAALETISGKSIPEKFLKERGRCLDAYADGHKYIFGKRVAIYGDEDLVTALASFVSEIGMIPVICLSGGNQSSFKEEVLKRVQSTCHPQMGVYQQKDFSDLDELIATCQPDIMIGNSKGYKTAKKFGVPLIRVGFPVHDRIGAQRMLHVGYAGTLELFDRITNALLEQKQEVSKTGYSYL